jgi:cell division septum initiation protein DivIVA
MRVSLSAGPRLTPDQVQGIMFAPARLGRRGLDEGQVQDFRTQVEHELVLLLEEKDSLRQEIERLRNRLLGGSHEDEPTADIRPEESHVQAVQILAKAQLTADRYVSDAQEYCRELAQDARRHRDQIVAEARTSAARVLKQAHDDASRAAAAVPASAEPLSTAERQQLQAELTYLRTFSDVCRTHLRAYLEAMARNVEEWERAEKTSQASVRAEPPRAYRNHA